MKKKTKKLLLAGGMTLLGLGFGITGGILIGNTV